jgi:hypothetical protein
MGALLREGNTFRVCGRTTRDEFDAWIDHVCETWDAGEQTVVLDLRTTFPTASWIVGRIARLGLHARRRGAKLVVRAMGMLARMCAAARLENFVELDPTPPPEADTAPTRESDPCPEASREAIDGLRGPFCQSCGVPMMGKKALQGTEADGSLSERFCRSCYRDGSYTDPGASIEDLAFKTSCILALRMGVDPETLAQSVASFMTRLDRWRTKDPTPSPHFTVLP